MIPILITYILKRSKFGNLIIKKVNAYKSIITHILCLLLLLLATSTSAFNLDKSPQFITYKILKNNKAIGTITIYKQKIKDSVIYTLNSKVDTKFIMKFAIEAEEKSVYKAGRLVYSSVYRKLNDKVKLNQSISCINGQYVFESPDKVESLSFNEIHRNLVTLFFYEPKGINKVYSDKFKKMVSITPIGKSKYKVFFPENCSNVYHYKSGRLIMVEVKGPFFKVKLLPAI